MKIYFLEYFGEYFNELDSLEKFVLIAGSIIFVYTWILVIYELIDNRKMRKGYIVDKSFLSMEERCGERLDKDVKITVRNRYVTNYICDIDD